MELKFIIDSLRDYGWYGGGGIALIFIILNSKIVWSQFGKLPFMGSMDPSMLALLINSLLSGIIFYIITTYVIKS